MFVLRGKGPAVMGNGLLRHWPQGTAHTLKHSQLSLCLIETNKKKLCLLEGTLGAASAVLWLHWTVLYEVMMLDF